MDMVLITHQSVPFVIRAYINSAAAKLYILGDTCVHYVVF